VLDLDYSEDSAAEADANFVLTSTGGVVEIQMAAEADPFQRTQLDAMLSLAETGIKILCQHQQDAIRAAL